jgi:hypothetical protein
MGALAVTVAVTAWRNILGSDTDATLERTPTG